MEITPFERESGSCPKFLGTRCTHHVHVLAYGANGQDESVPIAPKEPVIPFCAPAQIAKQNSKMNYPQGKSRPGIPRDFEAVLPRVRDTILLLGGAVFGSELCSALRTGEQYRKK